MIHHNPRKTRKPGPNPPEMTESGDGKQLKAHNQSCKQDRKGTIKDNQHNAFCRKRSVMMSIMKNKHGTHHIGSVATILYWPATMVHQKMPM